MHCSLHSLSLIKNFFGKHWSLLKKDKYALSWNTNWLGIVLSAGFTTMKGGAQGTPSNLDVRKRSEFVKTKLTTGCLDVVLSVSLN